MGSGSSRSDDRPRPPVKSSKILENKQGDDPIVKPPVKAVQQTRGDPTDKPKDETPKNDPKELNQKLQTGKNLWNKMKEQSAELERLLFEAETAINGSSTMQKTKPEDTKKQSSSKETNNDDALNVTKTIPELFVVVQGTSPVKCVTVLGQEIFLIRLKKPEMEVYSCRSRLALPTGSILVKDKKSGTEMVNPQSMAACERFHCLYITDAELKKFFRIDMLRSQIDSYDVGTEPEGISVTRNSTVLITLPKSRPFGIKEFKTNGELIREIPLYMTIEYPRHCVALSTGFYAMCHGSKGSQHRVCIVDRDAKIVRSFGGPDGNENEDENKDENKDEKKNENKDEKKNEKKDAICHHSLGGIWRPTSLAVDRHDNILVADEVNGEIQVLTSKLNVVQNKNIGKINKLLRQQSKLGSPLAIHLDHRRSDDVSSAGCLYVGDASGRLIVFDLKKEKSAGQPSGSTQAPAPASAPEPASATAPTTETTKQVTSNK